jgi:SHS family lactate transporter-like MFS transporter
VADRYGRKLPLMVGIVWFAACNGAVAVAPTFTWVLVLRALYGIGMGAQWTSGVALAMENWPKRSRGIASGVLQGSWALGYILAAWVAAAVEPVWGWRAVFLMAAMPALLVLPLVATVPESRAWRRARDQEMRERSSEPISHLVARIAWACLLWGFSFSVYYGVSSLYPAMLELELGRDATGVAEMVSLFNLGMMAGSIACGAIAHRFGSVAALAIPGLLLLPALPLYTGAVPSLLWLGAFTGGVFGAGIAGVTPLLMTQLFSARVRARSVAIVYHIGALVAAVTPTLVASLAEVTALDLAESIMVVSGSAAALMVATLVFRPRRWVPLTAGARPAPHRGNSVHHPSSMSRESSSLS